MARDLMHAKISLIFLGFLIAALGVEVSEAASVETFLFPNKPGDKGKGGANVTGVPNSIEGDNIANATEEGRVLKGYGGTETTTGKVDIETYFIIDAPIREEDDDHGCSQGQRWIFGHCRDIFE